MSVDMGDKNKYQKKRTVTLTTEKPIAKRKSKAKARDTHIAAIKKGEIVAPEGKAYDVLLRSLLEDDLLYDTETLPTVERQAQYLELGLYKEICKLGVEVAGSQLCSNPRLGERLVKRLEYIDTELQIGVTDGKEDTLILDEVAVKLEAVSSIAAMFEMHPQTIGEMLKPKRKKNVKEKIEVKRGRKREMNGEHFQWCKDAVALRIAEKKCCTSVWLHKEFQTHFNKTISMETFRQYLVDEQILDIKKVQAIDMERYNVSDDQLREMLCRLRDLIPLVSPALIFNLDEIGFDRRKPPEKECCFEHGTTYQPHYPKTTLNKRASAVVTISGDFVNLPTMMIVPVTKLSRKVYTSMTTRDVVYAYQRKGFCTRDLFVVYLKTIFVPYVLKKRQELIDQGYTGCLTALLICDGFSGHLDTEIEGILREANIVMFVLPPHSSHLTQMLDLVGFANVKRVQQLLMGDDDITDDIDEYSKNILLTVKALRIALDPKCIRACFERAGIRMMLKDNFEWQACFLPSASTPAIVKLHENPANFQSSNQHVGQFESHFDVMNLAHNDTFAPNFLVLKGQQPQAAPQSILFDMPFIPMPLPFRYQIAQQTQRTETTQVTQATQVMDDETAHTALEVDSSATETLEQPEGMEIEAPQEPDNTGDFIFSQYPTIIMPTPAAVPVVDVPLDAQPGTVDAMSMDELMINCTKVNVPVKGPRGGMSESTVYVPRESDWLLKRVLSIKGSKVAALKKTKGQTRKKSTHPQQQQQPVIMNFFGTNPLPTSQRSGPMIME